MITIGGRVVVDPSERVRMVLLLVAAAAVFAAALLAPAAEAVAVVSRAVVVVGEGTSTILSFGLRYVMLSS